MVVKILFVCHGNICRSPMAEYIFRKLVSDAGVSDKFEIATSDYVYYDLIIGMDEMNIRNMKRVYHNDPEGKINLLLEYTDNCRSISDPWYSGDFDTAYREIEEGCIALFKYLTSESGHLHS